MTVTIFIVASKHDPKIGGMPHATQSNNFHNFIEMYLPNWSGRFSNL